MKNQLHHLMLLLLFGLLACQKDQPNQKSNKTSSSSLTIPSAKAWFLQQKDASRLQPLWQFTRIIPNSTAIKLVIPLEGQPTFQHTKQGYRRLLIQQDTRTKAFTAKVLEIIPDAVYHQAKGKLDAIDFSGRIFEYDLQYQLQGGLIYGEGKVIGKARAASTAEQVAIGKGSLVPSFIGDQTYRPAVERQSEMRLYGSCHWVTSTYIDSEGVFTVYAESYCNFYFDGGNPNETDMKSVIFDGGGGGGGHTYQPPAPPEPSNLPMEEQPSKDPKKLMDCFGSTQSPTAAYQVKILVQEPQPGTSFNVGQNAFGHVALQLSKTEGGHITTQTLGFYPSGTGLDKLSGRSRIVDNGGLSYNVSATYYLDAQNFQQIINYVKNPPADYHYTGFNCTNFVYQAALKGNIDLPNPTTGIGLGAPGNTATAMTPAGMGSALRDQKTSNPNANITTGNARAQASKGECN